MTNPTVAAIPVIIPGSTADETAAQLRVFAALQSAGNVAGCMLRAAELLEPPPGFVLVPMEPTSEMQYRGGEATAGKVEWDDAPDDAPQELAASIYRAMLAAAPAAAVKETP